MTDEPTLYPDDDPVNAEWRHRRLSLPATALRPGFTVSVGETVFVQSGTMGDAGPATIEAFDAETRMVTVRSHLTREAHVLPDRNVFPYPAE